MVVALFGISSSQAETRLWDGGGANDNWSTINNWDGNLTLPSVTADVIFSGSFTSGTSIDTVASRTINSLTISTLTGFTLGNAADTLTLTSGILNREDLVGTEANHTIISPIILGNNGVWTIDGSGTLTINGAIQDGGSSFSLEKSGAGVLVLSGAAETYNGNTTVNQGTLRLGADNQITNGAGFGNLIINSSGTFDLADFSDTINGLSGAGVVDKTTGANNETLTVGANNADGDFTGVIQNTDASDLLNLTKTGTGTQILSGNNTYRGTTTLSAGTLRATTYASALGAGALSLGGGTLELANNSGLSFNRNTTVSADTTIKSDVLTMGQAGVTHTLGTLSIGAQILTIGKGTNVGSGTAEIVFGAVTLTGSPTFSASLETRLTLGAITSGSADRTITFGGAGYVSVVGTIEDATGGAGNTTGLTKTGTGTLGLSASNTYIDVTTLSGGVLLLNHATALPGGIATAGGTSHLNLNGGVLGLGVGNFTRGLGTGVTQVQFTGAGGGFAAYSADRSVNIGGLVTPSTLTWASTANFLGVGDALILSASDATHTLDFQNSLGLNAAERTVQVENGAAAVDAILSGTISGTGASGLTKTGAGALSITRGNTYAGTTTVSAGELLANNTSGSATGTGLVSVAANAVLGGSGTIAPGGANGINVSGVMAPGGNINPGNLTFDLAITTGTVVMNSAASIEIELGVPGETIGAVGISDLISLAGAVAGDFTFNGNNVDFLGTGAMGYYKIFDTSSNNANTWTGLTFDSVTGLVSSGLSYSNLISGLGGNFIVGTASNGGTTGDIYFQAIPEPSVALLGGMGVLFLLRRKRPEPQV